MSDALTTEQVRKAYGYHVMTGTFDTFEQGAAEFDRWLAAHDDEKWDEGHRAGWDDRGHAEAAGLVSRPMADDARAEAERRWVNDGSIEVSMLRRGFEKGAEWQASRPVTDAEVEAVARVFLADYDEQYDAGSGIDVGTFESLARESLEAARKTTGDNS